MKIGCDIVKVKDIVKANKDGRLQQRILAGAELAELNSKSEQKAKGHKFAEREYSLAGRFAAKEATLKALGLGLGGLPLNEICVLHKSSGAPYISIENSQAKKLNISAEKLEISISHSGDYAMAVVVYND